MKKINPGINQPNFFETTTKVPIKDGATDLADRFSALPFRELDPNKRHDDSLVRLDNAAAGVSALLDKDVKLESVLDDSPIPEVRKPYRSEVIRKARISAIDEMRGILGQARRNASKI